MWKIREAVLYDVSIPCETMTLDTLQFYLLRKNLRNKFDNFPFDRHIKRKIDRKT